MKEAFAGTEVWIVEDNETMRNHLASLIRSYGLEAVPLASWKEASARIGRKDGADNPCVLALLDMEMPDMYGPDTWFGFQQAACVAGILTLVMTTAFGRDEMMGMAADRRLDGMIVKPFSRPELFRAIEALLEKGLLPKPEAGTAAGAAEPNRHAAAGKRILLAEITRLTGKSLRKCSGSADIRSKSPKTGRKLSASSGRAIGIWC